MDLTEVSSEGFYRHLFDAAGEGMIVVDGRGIIALANKRVETLFGYCVIIILLEIL